MSADPKIEQIPRVHFTPQPPQTPPPVQDNPLVLVPEAATTDRPAGTRRPFQRRRRSRACDACRARKTKCDTPDQGPCSACIAASLVCRFSQGGEDRRRTGPARRIQTLEAQVSELTKKLQDAEALLGGPGPIAKRSVPPSASSSPQFSSAESTIGSSGQPHHDCPQNADWWRPLHLEADTRGGSAEHIRGGMPFGPLGFTVNPEHLTTPHSASWSRSVFDSNPPFVASYKAYLRHLGYPASGPEYPTAQQQVIHGEQHVDRVPLLSEYPAITSKTLPLDLRVFLPPKPFAERLREVFRRTIQNYTPLFYWPLFLEEKFDRAWARPMWEEDTVVVKSVFCVVQMVLAVACQMTEEESPELVELSGGGDLQERAGWKFFHLGRKYADLNSPHYSSDDAMFLLLMSLYLDNASLPSPCWMMTGAMARVCQDVVLDRNPPLNMFSEVELECRRRLFWAAYIQERKESLKKGRAVILHDSDVEIPLPKALEKEDRRGSGTLASEGGGEAKPLSPSPSCCVPVANPLSAEESLQVMTAQIHISMLCGTLISVRPTENGGIQDLHRIQDVDHKLKRAWDGFPSHLTDLQNMEPIDMGAIRPLFYLQYCRLLLYRFFTEPALNPEFRTFCLAQSIQVSKISAHLVFRASRNEDFDKCFGMCTEELVHLQTFRTAVILLIGHCSHEPPLLYVTQEEVNVCVRALRSIAAYHALGKKLLDVFEGFARTFGYQSDHRFSEPPPPPPNTETATPAETGAAEAKPEVSTPSSAPGTRAIDFVAPQPAHPALQWEFYSPNYSHSSASQPTTQTQHTTFGSQYVPASAWTTDPMQSDYRLAGLGDLGQDLGGAPVGHRERTTSIGDLRLDWEAVQQTLQFGDGVSGSAGGASVAGGQQQQPGFSGWTW